MPATTCPSCGVKNIEGVDECANCGADLRDVGGMPKATSQMEQAVMSLPLTSLQISQMEKVPSTTTLEAAMEMLDRQKLNILAVVDDEKLVGLLSVRDVLTRVGADYMQKLKLPISLFMTAAPETLPPTAQINFAINLMDVGGYRHVPVVQNERIVGVVSTRDVIRHILQHSRGTISSKASSPSRASSETPRAS